MTLAEAVALQRSSSSSTNDVGVIRQSLKERVCLRHEDPDGWQAALASAEDDAIELRLKKAQWKKCIDEWFAVGFLNRAERKAAVKDLARVADDVPQEPFLTIVLQETTPTTSTRPALGEIRQFLKERVCLRREPDTDGWQIALATAEEAAVQLRLNKAQWAKCINEWFAISFLNRAERDAAAEHLAGVAEDIPQEAFLNIDLQPTTQAASALPLHTPAAAGSWVAAATEPAAAGPSTGRVNTSAGSSTPPSITEQYPFQPPTGGKCLVFISHAGEQKYWLAEQVLSNLQSRGLAGDQVTEGRQGNRMVFLDEKSLQLGNDAMKEIYESLRDAFVVVVLLSADFISKRYPMQELQLLLEWRRHAPPEDSKQTRQVILPVLVGLDFNDLDKVKTQYRAAAKGEPLKEELPRKLLTVQYVVDEAVEKGQSSLLGQWADDLDELGGITSLREDKCPWYPEKADAITKATVQRLVHLGKMPSQHHDLELPEQQVNLQQQAQRIVEELIQQQQEEETGAGGKVLLKVLTGMGGIGKTTLGKAVFNQLKDRIRTLPCCFLQLAKDMAEDAVLRAQKEVLKKLGHVDDKDMPGSVPEGKKAAGEKLKGRRVLLFVDNVWGKALSSSGTLDRLLPPGFVIGLGAGSIILVTARQASVVEDNKCLRPTGGQQDVEVHMEPMKFLSGERSVDLLCKHAFVDNHAHPTSEERPDVALLARRCGGLPMALAVMGQYLRFCLQDASVKDVLAYVNSRLPSAIKDAFGNQTQAVGDGQEQTLFHILELSWEKLADKGSSSQGLCSRQAVLMDIAWLLRDKEWPWVELYCHQELGLLSLLKGLGLLLEDGIHDTVVEFCKSTCPNWGLVLDTEEEAESFHDWLTDQRSAKVSDGKYTDVKGFQVTVGYTESRSCWMSAVVGWLSKEHCTLRVLRLSAECWTHGTVSLNLGSSLRWLEVGSRVNKKLVLQKVAPLSSLTCAQLEGCAVSLSNLKELGCQKLLGLKVDHSFASSDLASLRSLRKLDVVMWSHHVDNVNHLSGLASLQALHISKGDHLTSLKALSGLLQLTQLQLSSCRDQKNVDLSGLKSLKQLKLVCFNALGELNLGDLSCLESVALDDMKVLRSLELPQEPTSHLQLRVDHCSKLVLLEVPGAKVIDVAWCHKLDTIRLGGLGASKRLRVEKCNSLEVVEVARTWTRPMCELSILGTSVDLAALQQKGQMILHNDQQVFGKHMRVMLDDVTFLSTNSGMVIRLLVHKPAGNQQSQLPAGDVWLVDDSRTEVIVQDCNLLRQLELCDLSVAKKIQVTNCPKLRTIRLLGGLESLQTLRIAGCKYLKLLEWPVLPAVKEIHISACPKLDTIRLLGGLESLQLLLVEGCRSHLTVKVDLSCAGCLTAKLTVDGTTVNLSELSQVRPVHFQPKTKGHHWVYCWMMSLVRHNQQQASDTAKP